MSIISSPDENGDISLKDSQSLVNVISLLAHHLEPDGQQVSPQNSDIQGLKLFCTAHVIFSVIYGLHFVLICSLVQSVTGLGSENLCRSQCW